VRRVKVPNLIHMPFSERASIPEGKLRDYVLNPEHPKGWSKAKFFEEQLGIRREDWEYLHDEILGQLPERRVSTIAAKNWREAERNHFGIEFGIEVGIHGLNGQRRKVFTGWLVVGSLSPAFTTAFPCRR
jgi:filamentous hemagglutinin